MESHEKDYSLRNDTRSSETRPPRKNITIVSGASELSKNDLVARDLGCGGSMGSRSYSPNMEDLIRAERETREAIRQRQAQGSRPASGVSSPYLSFRDQVKQISMVIIEIKTNMMVDDPYRTISKLVASLRDPFNSQPIMMSIDDRVNIVMGDEPAGEPAYLVTVTALAATLTPLCNYRITTNVQRQILKEIGIPPGRGMVKLQAMPEDNLGTNEITYGQRIRGMEEASNEGKSVKNISRKASTSNRLSVISAPYFGFLKRFRSKSTLSSRDRRGPDGMSSDNGAKSN